MTNAPYGGYSQYPNAPYPGSAAPQAAVKPATPGSVWIAWLIYLLTAVAAVVGIVLVVTSDVWDRAVADAATQNLTVNVNSLKVIAVAIGVIFAALFLFFDFMMRAGRNWSRIVLTVLSALSIISAVGSSASTKVTVGDHVYTASSSAAIGWVEGVLALLAIILMFLPASNAYFSASLAFRKGTYR